MIKYIDALIPLDIGILIILYPSLFTKADSVNFEKNTYKLKKIGFLLIAVSLGFVVISYFEK